MTFRLSKMNETFWQNLRSMRKKDEENVFKISSKILKEKKEVYKR